MFSRFLSAPFHLSHTIWPCQIISGIPWTKSIQGRNKEHPSFFHYTNLIIPSKRSRYEWDKFCKKWISSIASNLAFRFFSLYSTWIVILNFSHINLGNERLIPRRVLLTTFVVQKINLKRSMKIQFLPQRQLRLLLQQSSALVLKVKRKKGWVSTWPILTGRSNNDFFHYANGNWIKSNPIPADQARWELSVFSVITTEKPEGNSGSCGIKKGCGKGSPWTTGWWFWSQRHGYMKIESQGVQPVKAEMEKHW